MKSLTEKYNAVLEGRYEKFHFLRDVRMSHPNLINQFNGFEDTVQILKNKGMISETYPGPVVTMNTIPLEALERGVDVELEEMGLDSVEVPTPEDHKKASDKALKNLEKNVLHYLEKLADVKPEAKRTDVMKDVKKDNVVDTDNGLKKVELNEMAIAKDLIKNLIKKALNEETEEDTTDQPTEEPTQANAQSDRERKIKVRNALDATLGTLEGRVNLEDLADPKVLDMYLDNLRDEIQSRTQMEDLTQPNLQEAQPRKRFTYEGTIV